MDHSELIAELPDIERMTAQERISLARERRRLQLRRHDERERALPPPRPRRQRLHFSAEVELLEATCRADYNEVERLLNEGANPNLHNDDGLTPLHQCAIDDNQQIMLLLLERGANVNAQDTEQWTPLHAAACCAHINIVRILIAAGANLLAVNAEGNMPYDICDHEETLDVIESEMATRGITQNTIDAMRGAPEKTMLDDMKMLHQQGRDLDVRAPDGSTYLHAAAANGYYDVAAFLLTCSVPPTIRDNDFWQPIHAAAAWAEPDVIELLCQYGGDIRAKTKNGETAIDLCEDLLTKQVIQTLVQTEARRKRLAFGVRDSRRQSKKRKKFESPQQGVTSGDNPFSARGAIRRQSLRDRSGLTPARIEAQKEGADILRTWSKEDVSSDVHASHAGSLQHQRESPSKRVLKMICFQTRTIQNYKVTRENMNVEVTDLPLKTIEFSGVSSINDMGINSDGTLLAILHTSNNDVSVDVFEIQTLCSAPNSGPFKPVTRTRVGTDSTNQGSVLEWNPAFADTFAASSTDRSILVAKIDIKNPNSQKLVGIGKLGAITTAISWSPKGKQLTVGDSLGKVIQLKPELDVVRSQFGPVHQPPYGKVTGLCWLATTEWLVSFANGTDHEAYLMRCKKDKPTEWIQYHELSYSSSKWSLPAQLLPATQLLVDWNIVLVGNSKTSEIVTVGKREDWTTWVSVEGESIYLPTTANSADTVPVGVCIDRTQTEEVLLKPDGSLKHRPSPLVLCRRYHCSLPDCYGGG